MRLFDAKVSDQDIIDSGQDDDFAQPVFDKTSFGEQDWKV